MNLDPIYQALADAFRWMQTATKPAGSRRTQHPGSKPTNPAKARAKARRRAANKRARIARRNNR